MGEIRLSRFTTHSAPEKIASDLIPLMQILARHRLPVMFLTAWTQFGSALYHGMPLFVDDLAERFPEVPIIITKMGRGYDTLFEICLLIAYKHENVYLDTVQTRPDHLARAVAEIGAERIMFGTDWEQSWCAIKSPADIYTRSLSIIDESGISAVQREWVLGKTAASLFRI
jgi:predicted TIM-barrel fold metal-dependent hydrolase